MGFYVAMKSAVAVILENGRNFFAYFRRRASRSREEQRENKLIVEFTFKPWRPVLFNFSVFSGLRFIYKCVHFISIVTHIFPLVRNSSQ